MSEEDSWILVSDHATVDAVQAVVDDVGGHSTRMDDNVRIIPEATSAVDTSTTGVGSGR